jgi:hypothetical protein
MFPGPIEMVVGISARVPDPLIIAGVHMRIIRMPRLIGEATSATLFASPRCRHLRTTGRGTMLRNVAATEFCMAALRWPSTTFMLSALRVRDCE